MTWNSATDSGTICEVAIVTEMSLLSDPSTM